MDDINISKVDIRGRVWGGERQLNCIPLLSRNKCQLIKDASEAIRYDPDVLEWRVEAFSDVRQTDAVSDALRALHKQAQGIPILITPRHTDEGGISAIDPEHKAALIKTLAQTGLIDLVDIELLYPDDYIINMKDSLHSNGVKLILSHHNLNEFESDELIIKLVKRADRLGADIIKYAPTPSTFHEMLQLMQLTINIKENITKKPVIAIAKGVIGSMSRIMGGYYGSAMTYVTADIPFKPEHMHIDDLRAIQSLLTGFERS